MLFPMHSPRIDRVEVIARGEVRRARLYYLRQRSGKAARIKERSQSQKPVEATAEKQ